MRHGAMAGIRDLGWVRILLLIIVLQLIRLGVTIYRIVRTEVLEMIGIFHRRMCYVL